jgi:hypothetical protein
MYTWELPDWELNMQNELSHYLNIILMGSELCSLGFWSWTNNFDKFLIIKWIPNTKGETLIEKVEASWRWIIVLCIHTPVYTFWVWRKLESDIAQ